LKKDVCFGLIIDGFNNLNLQRKIYYIYVISFIDIIKLYIYFCCTSDSDKTYKF